MSLRSIHNKYAPKGGGGSYASDFWRPSKGDNFFRLYRYQGDDGEELFDELMQHWPDPKQGPILCTGDGCTACMTSAKLRAAGDDASRDQGWQWRATGQFRFVGVTSKEPTGYKIWRCSSSQALRVLHLVTQVGGWIGDRPLELEEGIAPEEFMTREEAWTRYDNAFNDGVDKVCGPSGWDIKIVYDPNQKDKKLFYHFSIIPSEDSPNLEFAEDENVPVPARVQAKIEAAKSAKAQRVG